MWTDWKKKIDPNYTIPQHLLWDMDMEKFNMKKGRALVVERVIERGRDNDYYTIFHMYGGPKGVRKIIKNEIKHFRWPWDESFARVAFELKEEEMACYKSRQLRKKLFNS